MGSILEEHNVRLLGSGDAAAELVVLGHGFGTDQSVWQHIVPHLLDDDYRLLLLDLMGAGSTNPDNFSFARYSSLHGYADDLLAILEEVGAQQCTYVGHSVSGMIGCIAAIARPEAFKKIVLIGASPRCGGRGRGEGGLGGKSGGALGEGWKGDGVVEKVAKKGSKAGEREWYLNDVDYFGGFEQEDLNQLFAAMHSNFRAWVSGFAPLAVGADINSAAVQEFSRTFFCIRPDIALSVSKTIFQSDMRSILPQVKVPCHILQSSQDLAVPVAVAEYMHAHLGGKSVVEIFPTHGHLPQLSAPHMVIPVLRRHLHGHL
ncbi:unnamed protein product [Closterium sp. Naga37s-1]|nr:unnamed protein product [Closterium sp. Naga37s-1]